jgi:uncharacterized membrane protein YdjX (TVP38/TMEM64 family)
VRKIIILAIILAVLAIIFFWARGMGYLENINPEQVYSARDDLLMQVSNRLFISSLIFVLIYFTAVAVSIPGATFLTLTGGFLFGPVLGTVLVNIGASTGALAVFLAARYFLGSQVQRKYGEKLKTFNREIETNGSSYLLTLRFIPIFPFFLINLLSGFTTIKTRTFIWTTVLGILPGSFVYAYLGYAGSSLEAGETLLTPQIITALCMLAVISLVPVLYRKIKKRKKGKQDEQVQS